MFAADVPVKASGGLQLKTVQLPALKFFQNITACTSHAYCLIDSNDINLSQLQTFWHTAITKNRGLFLQRIFIDANLSLRLVVQQSFDAHKLSSVCYMFLSHKWRCGKSLECNRPDFCGGCHRIPWKSHLIESKYSTCKLKWATPFCILYNT